MKNPLIISTVLLGSLALSTNVLAQCSIEKKPKELSLDEVNTHYQCARDSLISGYQKGDNPVAKDYVNWKAAATGPAKPGFHSNRYLMTYVNEIGHSTYVAYASSDVNMPIGSLVAKESYKLKKGGKIKAGPLFIMEKVGADKAPKADGWLYSGVKANGKPMKFKQAFCHNCHKAYKAQDALGYPVPDVRLQ